MTTINFIAPITLLALFTTGPGHALTPEELLAQIDERAAQSDPYRAALNDPDPVRSRAAVEIMIESGEPDLVRMASEFAIRSPDTALRRLAVEGIVSTKVPLTVILDPSDGEDTGAFVNAFNNYQEGAIEPDGKAYVVVRIGDYDATKGCYLQVGQDACGVQVNGDGVFVTQNYLAGRFGYAEDGALTGAARIEGHATPLAASITIIE